VVIDSDSDLRESVVLALAWTVADLAGRSKPGRDELAIALAMRRGEQPGTARREVG
jgi:magnesium chelatase family protein